jgi:hypothetical protein
MSISLSNSLLWTYDFILTVFIISLRICELICGNLAAPHSSHRHLSLPAICRVSLKVLKTESFSSHLIRSIISSSITGFKSSLPTSTIGACWLSSSLPNFWFIHSCLSSSASLPARSSFAFLCLLVPLILLP